MGQNHRQTPGPLPGSVSTIILQLDHLSGQFQMKEDGPVMGHATMFYGMIGLAQEVYLKKRLDAPTDPLIMVPRIQ